jgi:hypothetical protein
LIGHFKGTKKIAGVKDDLKTKVEEGSESLKEWVDVMKEKTEERLLPLKEVGKRQLGALKEEARDLKKIFDSKDLVFFKNDAMAVVLRKLGGFDEFLAACAKLTKEGYRMVNREKVETLFEIPIPGFKLPLGTFYYFQHVKFITRPDADTKRVPTKRRRK